MCAHPLYIWFFLSCIINGTRSSLEVKEVGRRSTRFGLQCIFFFFFLTSRNINPPPSKRRRQMTSTGGDDFEWKGKTYFCGSVNCTHTHRTRYTKNGIYIFISIFLSCSTWGAGMPEEKRQTLEGGGTVFDSNKYPTDMHRPSQVVIVSRLFNWLLLLFTVVMGMCVCGGGGGRIELGPLRVR